MEQLIYGEPKCNEVVRDFTSPTSTHSLDLWKVLEEIEGIKEEAPDLYEALAKDDPNLIE